MAKVYNEKGRLLGDEYIDVSGLELDTKKAIIQLIHLDKTVAITKLFLAKRKGEGNE